MNVPVNCSTSYPITLKDDQLVKDCLHRHALHLGSTRPPLSGTLTGPRVLLMHSCLDQSPEIVPDFISVA